MKKITRTLTGILAVAAALALPIASHAQDKKEDKKPAGERPPGGAGGDRRAAAEERFKKMAEDLKLTDEQKTKVQENFRDMMQKGRELRENTALSQEDRQAKGREMRESFQAKMKEILTKEQFEKFEKQQAEFRRGPGGERPKPPQN